MTDLPRSDRWLVGGFEKHFLPGYLRKHFHVVAANRQSLAEPILSGSSSMVVYANHASWWDPMIALYLRSSLMPKHCLYAPIDASALERYKIFARMGFYGIELGSHRGAAEFLKRSARILQSPTASLWLTPEGQFCDARKLDQPFMPGLAHLAHKVSHTAKDDAVTDHSQSVWFVPAAIEYVFWEERLPECLVWFGECVEVQWDQSGRYDKLSWNELLFKNLRSAQCQLATASVARDTSPFQILLSGAAGSWRVYDWARKMVARIRGQELSLEHSQGVWEKR